MICTCGRDNRDDARFCDACGARLDAAAAASGERRQLTALFCDIVEYTRLAARIDEEDLHQLIGAYQRQVSEIVRRWDGDIDFYAGDGVNACFGYPKTHEDDAERAIRAALDIVQAIRTFTHETSDARSEPVTIAVRIGIHTGPVVVGELGTGEHRKRQPLGSTLNVAARLQTFAQPGAIVISDATERLVSGRFVCDDLGEPPLKGVDAPIRVYAVRRSSGTVGQHIPRLYSTSPLIGRQSELAQLRQCWDTARSGHGQAVLISGDAGIGKSKLVRRFVEDAVGTGDARAYEWRCSPFHTGTPLHPIIEGVAHQVGIEPGQASREEIASRVESFLRTTGVEDSASLTLADLSTLIGEIVSPGVQSDGPSMETPVVRRARILQRLCDLARGLARSHPTVLVVEDLHWADPSTLELVGLLIAGCRDVPLLLLLTFRPVFNPMWPTADNMLALGLDPLGSAECAELLDTVIGDKVLPRRAREELLARGDGVPLFVEELARAVLDRPFEGPARVLSTIPNTLHGPLVSRIDNVSASAHETIHLASTLSRQFRFELIEAVSDKPAALLQQDLDELVHAGLVYRSGATPLPTYGFRHALIAEAAYDSIVRTERRRLHGRIAHRLESAFPVLAQDQPEILAHHFEEAGETEAAVAHWRRAGESAASKGAYQEAVKHFDRGLAAMSVDGAEQIRRRYEIELTESKGTALFSTLGYSHPLVESTFARAMTLCDEGHTAPPLRVLYGLWAVHVSRSNAEAVDTLLPRFHELAHGGEPVALLTAHANTGMRAFFRGEFEECLAQMTTATGWYATAEHSTFLKRHGYGGGLYPYAWRMWALSILGRPEQAFATEAELERLATQAANPYGLAIAGGFRVNLARDRRDPIETLELADRQIQYTKAQMLPLWEGPAHCARGWARVRLGSVAEGLDEIRLGLYYLDAVGLRATYTYHWSSLVESLLVANEADAALREVRQAVSMGRTLLDRFYEAELLRLEAECHRRLGDPVRAAECLHAALALADRQGARFFSLRAAESLIGLRSGNGELELARRELEPYLAALSVGVDATEVLKARQLSLGATV